jgi:hypothetical protein
MWIDTYPGIGGTADPADTQLRLEVFGGPTACSGSDLLWTSPPLTKSWATYCVTVSQSTASVTFNAEVNDTNATAFVLVDHVVPVASCP